MILEPGKGPPGLRAAIGILGVAGAVAISVGVLRAVLRMKFAEFSVKLVRR